MADVEDKLKRALVELCGREDAGRDAALPLLLEVLDDHVHKQRDLGSRPTVGEARLPS